MPLQTFIELPLEELAPPAELFRHYSTLHGPLHVSRVMVHAFALLGLLDLPEEAPRLWASVYLHDLARRHDGVCHAHGGDAVERLESLPQVKALFARGGVREEDYGAIATAVTQHSRPREIVPDHPHRRLTALLKDADGLDRVRLWDLDPDYLRFPEAVGLVRFAERLYRRTDSALKPGPELFPQVWAIAQALWAE